MSFGMPCIVTNNWGFSEYCIDNYNSIMIENKSCDECKKKGYPVCQHILANTSIKISELCENRQILQNMSMNTLSNSIINYSKEEYAKKIIDILKFCNIN